MNKYDAFISYRHKELDKAVARKLQKLLEAYRPPRDTECERTRKINRIFLDETELPTSGNLGADIKSALENSSFLILICSKETKESKWCMQEIDYFKELHNGKTDKILTILVDGDPNEVFPDSLCWEEQEITSESGKTTQYVKIEPLAANVISDSTDNSLKKLKTEFLRIAAPILGCGYDDLYKRHQRRFMTRFIAAAVTVTVLLLCFTIGITEMLRQNELAANERAERYIDTAETLIDNGDMMLATAVIDDLMNKTPKPSEYLKNKLEKVLMQSTYIPKYAQYATLSSDDGVNDFVLSADGTEIYTATSGGKVFFWDIKNGNKKAEFEAENTSVLKLVQHDNVLYALTSDSHLYVLDAQALTVTRMFGLSGDTFDQTSEIHDMMYYDNNIYLTVNSNASLTYKIDLNADTIKDITPLGNEGFISNACQCFLDGKAGRIIYSKKEMPFWQNNLNEDESYYIGISDYKDIIDYTYNEDTGHIITISSKDTGSDTIAVSVYDSNGTKTKGTDESIPAEQPYRWSIVDVSKDERYILLKDLFGNILVIDLEKPKHFWSYKESKEIIEGAFISDDMVTISCGSAGAEVVLWKFSKHRQTTISGFYYYCRFLTSDNAFAVCDRIGNIGLFSLSDSATETVVSEDNIESPTNSFEGGLWCEGGSSISPDGKYEMDNILLDGKIALQIKDRQTGNVLCDVKTPIDEYISYAVRDTELAALISQSGVYYEFNPQTGQTIRSAQLEIDNKSFTQTSQLVVDFDNMRASVINKTSSLSSCAGALYSTQTFEKLLDYPHANRIEANLTCDKIYRRIAQNDDEWIEILIPDYDRLCELSREQLSGRILTDEEKQRLNLN